MRISGGEKANNAPIGNSVSATDKDPLLTYALSGDDASAFKVDNNGQIKYGNEAQLRDEERVHGRADGDRPVDRD